MFTRAKTKLKNDDDIGCSTLPAKPDLRQNSGHLDQGSGEKVGLGRSSDGCRAVNKLFADDYFCNANVQNARQYHGRAVIGRLSDVYRVVIGRPSNPACAANKKQTDEMCEQLLGKALHRMVLQRTQSQ